MNISELYVSDNTNLVKNHDILMKLQEKGLKVDAIYNKHISRFDENFISVNDFLCFILPMDNSPRILSDTILTDTDFIIATSKIGSLVTYYIIPSDDILQNRSHYPLEYISYKDKWDFFNL